MALPRSADWTENCTSCGSPHSYAYSFDDRDRQLILDYTAGFKLKSQVYWKAPHGPEPACDARYADLQWSQVRSLLPKLKRETFESFLQRNKPVPAHRGNSWKSADGRSLVIITKPSDAPRISRAGFDAAETQALVYSGGGTMELFEKRGGRWVFVDNATLWIS